MAKKKEVLVQCVKCKKMEARVTKVILDDDGKVYSQHPYVMALFFLAAGIFLVPRVPEMWQIPLGVALGILGALVVVRTFLKRRRLPRAREMYCYSCYHFWYEKEPVSKS